MIVFNPASSILTHFLECTVSLPCQSWRVPECGLDNKISLFLLIFLQLSLVPEQSFPTFTVYKHRASKSKIQSMPLVKQTAILCCHLQIILHYSSLIYLLCTRLLNSLSFHQFISDSYTLYLLYFYFPNE